MNLNYRHPKSGSFVRPEAVCTGKELTEEMNDKYTVFLSDEEHEIGSGSKKVDFVNMEKTYKKQKCVFPVAIIVAKY